MHLLADSEYTYDAVFAGCSLAFTQTEGLLPFTLKSHGIYHSQLTITQIAYTTTSNFNHRRLIPLTVRRMLMDITNALKHSCPCQKLTLPPFVCVTSLDIWKAILFAVKGLQIVRESKHNLRCISCPGSWRDSRSPAGSAAESLRLPPSSGAGGRSCWRMRRMNLSVCLVLDYFMCSHRSTWPALRSSR